MALTCDLPRMSTCVSLICQCRDLHAALCSRKTVPASTFYRTIRRCFAKACSVFIPTVVKDWLH